MEYTDKSIKQVFQYFKGKISKDEIRLLADSNLWYLLCFVHTKIMPRKIKGGLMKEYTDKQINSMILHLRLEDIAEIYYLDIKDPETRATHDRGFYDYKTNSWISRKELSACAIETGWKDKKEK